MINMGRIIEPYHAHLSAVSAGATFDDLKDTKVDAGHILRVKHLSIENLTSAYTSFRIGINRRGSIRFLFEEVTIPAAQIFYTDADIEIVEGSSIIFRAVGCTSGDIIVADVMGVLYHQCGKWGRGYA